VKLQGRKDSRKAVQMQKKENEEKGKKEQQKRSADADVRA